MRQNFHGDKRKREETKRKRKEEKLKKKLERVAARSQQTGDAPPPAPETNTGETVQ